MVAGIPSKRSSLPSPVRKRHRIGPKDNGRLMTLVEFESYREKPGYIYELIDGVLNVSPLAKPPHERWVVFLRDRLIVYGATQPRNAPTVLERCEVVVPGRVGVSRPQPDLAVYRDYPRHEAMPADWDALCPCVVVEVISRRRAPKDTVRNRQLYWLVEGIEEYWIVDPRKDADHPVLVALRREANNPDWVERKVPFGERYETPALPGFVLNLADAAR